MKKIIFAVIAALFSIAADAGLPALDKVLAVEAGAEPIPSYKYALTDLNMDGLPDAVVFFTSREFCGSGGCSMSIYKGTAAGFVEVSYHTITREPIYVLPEVKVGWHSISVLRSGGGAPSAQTLLEYNGKNYEDNGTHVSSAAIRSAQLLILH